MSVKYSGLYAHLNHVNGSASQSAPPTHQTGHNNMKNGNKTFTFRKRFERVDWKRIAAADVDAITRDLDIQTLQENIMNVTFCNIVAELDVRTIDPNFIKLYKLAQLVIEYLLHSQDYLSGAVSDISQHFSKEKEEHEATRKKLEAKEKELAELKKESHKRKKMLLAQQHMLQAGANSYNKCPYCSKAFLNLTFLQSHLARRHTENVSQYNSMVAGQLQQSVPPQVMATPQSMPAGMVNGHASGDEELRQALELELSKIKERLQLTESQLEEERNMRNSIVSKEQQTRDAKQHELEQKQQHWQQQQLEKHKEEVDRLQEMFMRELKEMNTKYSSLEQSLNATQKRKKSQLGTLQDDVEDERAMLQEQRSHMAQMSEEFQHKLDSVESMKLDLERQQKALNKQMVQISRQQKERPQQKHGKEKEAEREQQEALHQAYQQQEDQVQHLEQVKQARPATAAEAAAVSESQVYYDDDEEQEDDEEDEEDEEDDTTGVEGSSTMGTNTYGTLGTGDLTMSGTRSLRLVDELKKNPTILQGLRRELKSILERELEKRGVAKGLAGVTPQVFNDKMVLLKQERQLKGKKHHNFLDIRQQYLDEIEMLAWQKLNANKPRTAERAHSPQQRRSPSPPYQSQRHSSPGQAPAHRQSPGQAPARPRQPHHQTQPQHQIIQSQPKRQSSSQRPSSHTGDRSVHYSQPLPASQRTPAQQGSSPGVQRTSPGAQRPAKQNAPPVPERDPPRPAPRTASPTGKMHNTGSTISSTGQSRPGTVGSSPWDTDSEESEEEGSTEDEETEEEEEEPPHMNVQVNVPRAQQPAPHPDEEDDDEDDGWDSISELEEVNLGPQRGGVKYSTTPIPASSTPKKGSGSGEKVAVLSRSIELQLSGRGGKKPAGGVNTMPAQGSVKRQSGSTSYDDEDDDLPSVSSLDDETASVPQERHPAPRRSAMRGSAQDTSASTNTYNTSLWGSSAKAASTAHHRGSTAGRTSAASVTDWDDYDDFST